jgi:hypothetical protein
MVPARAVQRAGQGWGARAGVKLPRCHEKQPSHQHKLRQPTPPRLGAGRGNNQANP